MEPFWTQQILHLIKETWKELPVARKPWGVWITLHAPLPANADSLMRSTLPFRRAWFLTDSMGMPQERSIWAFTRFWVMHFERPWDEAGCASSDPHFSADYYAIGLAAFAPYAGSNDIYLETIWAGLSGFGQRLSINAHGLIEPGEGLWIS